MLQRNALVTVVVDGESLGTWITTTEINTTADGQKIRLGGMSDETAFGGPASTDNPTVTRLFDTYMQSKAKALRKKVGLAVPMSVTYNALDNSKKVTYSETVSGVLNGVKTPPADDNSSEFGYIELELLADQATS